MSAPTFDLTDKPWVRVRLRSGDLAELSLRDVFGRAHEIVAISGDLPTQDVAILRLLLAILRRSHPEEHGTAAWGELWHRGSLDPAPITAYLDRYRDRFDLLHPQTPFYQVAGLATAKGMMTDLARLIPDVPPGFAYFTTRTGAALESMSLAEAARWVVHCQSFDPSGIKSGALGDDRVKGGKGYPIGIAWCGWLGLVVIEGDTLFETLLLNLPLGLKDSDPARDLPVWERPPQTAAVEGREAPTGPADLMTWQSRRIRLGHDGARATGVLIANGDPLHPRNRFRDEFMTSWRRSEAQMRALGTKEDVFMPRGHIPDRSVWRGLEGLLAEGEEATATRVGRWLDWLGELQGVDEELPRDTPARMRAVGVQYGSQSSVIDDVTDDVLSLSVDVLSRPALRSLAVAGVHDADTAARLLGGLGAELAETSGASGDAISSARASARERAYAALDHPYRSWLRGLRADSERDTAHEEWQRTTVRIAVGIARELVRGAGPAAWVGREVPRGSGSIYLDAALAELGFQRQLRTTFSLAFETEPRGDAA